MDGDFFVAASMASTLSKLAMRYGKALQDQAGVVEDPALIKKVINANDILVKYSLKLPKQLLTQSLNTLSKTLFSGKSIYCRDDACYELNPASRSIRVTS